MNDDGLNSADLVVCVAGDWHGDAFAAVERINYAAERGADVIVHAGDLGVSKPRYGDRFLGAIGRALADTDLHLFLVPGNHDDYSVIDALPVLVSGLLKLTNRITVVPRGRRFLIGGSTWMGLSGAVSVDRKRLTSGNWWPQEAMTNAEVEQAIGDGQLVDVVVSHEAPSSVTVPGLDQPSPWPADVLADADAHRARLESVIRHVKPTLLIHGHHHRRHKTRVDLGYDRRRPVHDGVMDVYGLADQQSPIAANMIFVRPNGEVLPA